MSFAGNLTKSERSQRVMSSDPPPECETGTKNVYIYMYTYTCGRKLCCVSNLREAFKLGVVNRTRHGMYFMKLSREAADKQHTTHHTRARRLHYLSLFAEKKPINPEDSADDNKICLLWDLAMGFRRSLTLK